MIVYGVHVSRSIVLAYGRLERLESPEKRCTHLEAVVLPEDISYEQDLVFSIATHFLSRCPWAGGLDWQCVFSSVGGELVRLFERYREQRAELVPFE